MESIERTRGVPQQVVRLTIAFALAAVAFVVARHTLTPDTFGEQGHFRAAAIDSIVAHGIAYAGHQECEVCHYLIDQTRREGHHAGLSCEVCHGPAADHTASPVDVRPPAPRDRGFCPLCHSYDPARPTGFPQIDPVAHNPLTPCVLCHDPHAPEPPTVPEECTACHGQIARQKAVSHHASLSCTTCHETPEGHKTSPRDETPTKPTTRGFCATCHASGPESDQRAPRINMMGHNPDYACWQCHYPHYPEAGGQ